ncbi:MAG: hypothetical protein KGV44_06245 [Flavobacteriaceae bacterium]|nr:hypothetical protein [Flavobacteriaceae bacterium]
MNYITKKEDDFINIYNQENELVGGIEFRDATVTEIIVGTEKFEVIFDKKITVVKKDNEVIKSLQYNALWGSFTILENEYKITGKLGLNRGTIMEDKDKNTIVKTCNKSAFFKDYNCEIETTDQATILDIAITLYAHLFGSKMKSTAIFF